MGLVKKGEGNIRGKITRGERKGRIYPIPSNLKRNEGFGEGR